jgi:hypothetical protein
MAIEYQKYFECPSLPMVPAWCKSLFMAGGIVGCPNWQQELRGHLSECNNLVLINPRRENFPIDDPNAADEQIKWEFNAMVMADAISFWFCEETIQPIVLFELGRWSTPCHPVLFPDPPSHQNIPGKSAVVKIRNEPKKIFVGVHPNYPRRKDVEVQLSLIQPQLEIAYNLDLLYDQIEEWANISSLPLSPL